jgi:DNA-binding transcriptional regulator GbsR (MarR family)
LLNKYWLDENREILHTSSQRIPERLKQIEKGYFVVFNHKNGSFEIHHEDGLPNDSFQLWIPFKELDQRTIDRVLETRIENAKALMTLMERQNAKLEEDIQKQSDNVTQEIAKDIYRYCNNNHVSKDAPDDGAYTTRFL